MKDSFTIFYSWQMSRPENKQLISNNLNTAIDELRADGIKLKVDQDSRDTTRENSIDYIILQKIPNCDFFIGDITPVATIGNGKQIPNPNVMLELGYAVKAIGWARCILVWNLKYGDVDKAPFDIRNRSIVAYNSDNNPSRPLSKVLYEVLKDKVERYDQIIAEQNNQDIDYNVFQHWNNLISPQRLNDIINRIITNCAYFTKDFDILDGLQTEFSTQITNHYRNAMLENSRKNLNDSLRKFCLYLAGSEFDRVNENYWKMNVHFTNHDSIIENQIIQQVHNLGNDVLEKNQQYFDALQSVFGYIG